MKLEAQPCKSGNQVTLQTGQSTLSPNHQTGLKAIQTKSQTLTDGSINPKPQQLELPLFTIGGKLTQAYKPCGLMASMGSISTLTEAIQDGLRRLTIPGLDASLCRCPQCISRAQGGIWWIDEQTRDNVLKKRIPYKFTQGIGDVAVEQGE